MSVERCGDFVFDWVSLMGQVIDGWAFAGEVKFKSCDLKN